MKQEKILALKIANWLKVEYPWAMYRFDLAADLKLTIGQAKRNKELNRFKKYPDLFIAETNEYYSGLYIELKSKRSEIYKKDGSFRNSSHISGQIAMLRALSMRGYRAVFCCGFEEAKSEIEKYMKDVKRK